MTQLVNYFRIDFKREPTAADVQKIIDDYIREEVLCRQAWAEGIDRDEPKIRLQLKQMMEVRLADTADLAAPTDEQLQAFVNSRPELFRRNGVMPPLEQIRNPASWRCWRHGASRRSMRRMKSSSCSTTSSSNRRRQAGLLQRRPKP